MVDDFSTGSNEMKPPGICYSQPDPGRSSVWPWGKYGRDYSAYILADGYALPAKGERAHVDRRYLMVELMDVVIDPTALRHF